MEVRGEPEGETGGAVGTVEGEGGVGGAGVLEQWNSMHYLNICEYLLCLDNGHEHHYNY